MDNNTKLKNQALADLSELRIVCQHLIDRLTQGGKADDGLLQAISEFADDDRRGLENILFNME